jgi:hypothetical protein
MSAQVSNARGQPNFKRRLQDYLEGMLAKDPSFEDHESNSELHISILRDDMQKFKQILK